jgi:hypothetical protein
VEKVENLPASPEAVSFSTALLRSEAARQLRFGAVLPFSPGSTAAVFDLFLKSFD